MDNYKYYFILVTRAGEVEGKKARSKNELIKKLDRLTKYEGGSLKPKYFCSVVRFYYNYKIINF